MLQQVIYHVKNNLNIYVSWRNLVVGQDLELPKVRTLWFFIKYECAWFVKLDIFDRCNFKNTSRMYFPSCPPIFWIMRLLEFLMWPNFHKNLPLYIDERDWGIGRQIARSCLHLRKPSIYELNPTTCITIHVHFASKQKKL